MLANFYTQGEFATNGTRVFVHADIMDAFTKEFKKLALEAMNHGDPMDMETQVGALIFERPMQQGTRLHSGGKRRGWPTLLLWRLPSPLKMA